MPAAVPVPRRLILIGGGARSGKSRYALERAGALGPRRVLIATAEGLDDEMAGRIARHRAERGGSFQTVEEPVALSQTLGNLTAADVVLVDCLTLWVSNLLGRGAGPAQLDTAFADLEVCLAQSGPPTILVTNEVGLGLVPATALGRTFRDAVGDLHQRLAARADEVHVAVMGVILRVHPAPVEVMRRGGAVQVPDRAEVARPTPERGGG